MKRNLLLLLLPALIWQGCRKDRQVPEAPASIEVKFEAGSMNFADVDFVDVEFTNNTTRAKRTARFDKTASGFTLRSYMLSHGSWNADVRVHSAINNNIRFVYKQQLELAVPATDTVITAPLGRVRDNQWTGWASYEDEQVKFTMAMNPFYPEFEIMAKTPNWPRLHLEKKLFHTDTDLGVTRQTAGASWECRDCISNGISRVTNSTAFDDMGAVLWTYAEMRGRFTEANGREHTFTIRYNE
ncbi:MAG TPA: hypothetical protein VD996_05815 [Chitinophagaceae bacterium]|nr:hypothetical protein [Chitinophagaceae bacterium]